MGPSICKGPLSRTLIVNGAPFDMKNSIYQNECKEFERRMKKRRYRVRTYPR